MVRSSGSRVGRYELLDVLGTGGMAEVWRARLQGAAGFQRTVVLKRLLPHLARDAEFVRLFLAEAKLSSLLQHPNILPVFDFGQEEDWYFMTMEEARGCNLVHLLRSRSHGPPVDWPGFGAYTIREVCRALAYAHDFVHPTLGALRIIHRDVSPSNVMITDGGYVKLLDFGIAKARAYSENLTASNSTRGKVGYFSPQQARGEPFDHRADLFAAGVVLHELLTGRRLFKADEPMATVALVREARVAPPSTLNPEVPAELDAICMRALALREDDRWQTATEMADALDHVVIRRRFGASEAGAAVAWHLFKADAAEPSATVSLAGDRSSAFAAVTGTDGGDPEGSIDDAVTRAGHRRTGDTRSRAARARRAALAAVLVLAAAAILVTTWPAGKAEPPPVASAPPVHLPSPAPLAPSPAPLAAPPAAAEVPSRAVAPSPRSERASTTRPEPHTRSSKRQPEPKRNPPKRNRIDLDSARPPG